MDKVASIRRLNERELELGLSAGASWHDKYRDSAWVYVGGLSPELSEGDVICMLSQFGEIEDMNLPRDAKTGKPRGWCWAKYEDQRSTILAVDNFTGVQFLGRTLRVDHCEKYKLPKELKDRDDKYESGALYKDADLVDKHTLAQGQDVFAVVDEPSEKKKKKKKKKRDSDDDKKKKKKRKKEKKKIEEDLDVLPLRAEDEALIQSAGTEAPLVETQGRQGEVLAPSWRGTREPGAPQPAPTYGGSTNGRPPTTYEEREATQNKTYGGMLRRR